MHEHVIAEKFQLLLAGTHHHAIPADAVEPQTEFRKLSALRLSSKPRGHAQVIEQRRAKHHPVQFQRLGRQMQRTVNDGDFSVEFNPVFRQCGGLKIRPN